VASSGGIQDQSRFAFQDKNSSEFHRHRIGRDADADSKVDTRHPGGNCKHSVGDRSSVEPERLGSPSLLTLKGVVGHEILRDVDLSSSDRQ